ncbi:hypothetical protein CLU79DRAFT_765244 [Phycomyces nitens]|nr:hypothetical protein CLU79DRAFT_765244 [Phycomyces nitens]
MPLFLRQATCNLYVRMGQMGQNKGGKPKIFVVEKCIFQSLLRMAAIFSFIYI